MKYLITERQYRLLNEESEEILEIPFKMFNNDWSFLQEFIDRLGNPPYKIIGNLFFPPKERIKTLGSLTAVEGFLDISYLEIQSLGDLRSVTGSLNMYSCHNINSFGNLEYVGASLNIEYTPLAKKMTKQQIRKRIYVGVNIYL